MPPGARLLLCDIPKDLQRQFDVQATEEVTFVQLSAEAYQYRDAVRFGSGREVLLQCLRCGQHVDVLSLCSGENREEEHQRREEEYRWILLVEDQPLCKLAAQFRIAAGIVCRLGDESVAGAEQHCEGNNANAPMLLNFPTCSVNHVPRYRVKS